MATSGTTKSHDAAGVASSRSSPARAMPLSTWTLFLAVASAAALRFLFLARKPFWFDECFSVEVARLGWHDFLRLSWWREANMSFYYALLRAWLHLGGSPFFIRSLSVLASLATLPAIYWLGRQLFDRRVGMMALVLMSSNAYSVRYAQEARSYALFLLLATLASGCFVSCVRLRSRWNCRAYILTGVLATYAHLYALLLLASHGLALGGRTDEEAGQAWPRAGFRPAWIAIGVGVSPLLVFVAKTGAGPIRWIPRPSPRDVLEFFEHFAGNAGLPLLLLYGAAGLAAILPLRGRLLKSGADGRVWRVRFLLIWLLFPVALCLVLSLARPLFLGRYFIFCLPPFVILAAAGLASLRKAWMLGVCLAAMLLFSLQGTFLYYDHDFDLQRDHSQAAANYIYDHALPGDAILFHIAEARIPYEFFVGLREQAAGAGPRPEPQIVFPRHGDRLDYRDVTGNPTAEFLQSLAGRYARVWVVLMSNGRARKPDPTTFTIEQTLEKSFPHGEQQSFPQVEVWLYSK